MTELSNHCLCDDLQVDGYSSQIIIAKRDVIEYILEKIVKIRQEGKAKI